MRTYSNEILSSLAENAIIENTGGIDIELRMASDNNGLGKIDHRLINELEENLKTSPRKDSKPATLGELRELMGYPNRNLNTAEIYTRYVNVISPHGEVPVWMYYPRRMEGKRPALLYIHGGGFFGGSPFVTENPCRLIAELADCTVCNIDYSLPPEAPFPIPTEQIYSVLVHIWKEADRYRIDRNRIYIAGDSAGGNMAAVVAMMDRDRGTRYLAGEILLYAKLTFTNSLLEGYDRDLGQFYLIEEQKKYLEAVTGIGSDESNANDEAVYVQGRYGASLPYISPAFGKKEGLPETLMIQAEYDGLRLEGEFYAGQLAKANVPVKMIRYCGVMHAFFDRLGDLPQAEDAAIEIAKFIDK